MPWRRHRRLLPAMLVAPPTCALTKLRAAQTSTSTADQAANVPATWMNIIAEALAVNNATYLIYHRCMFSSDGAEHAPRTTTT